MIVAIDGPAGAGKSTIARGVAHRLGFQLIDTGAIYRAVAFHALSREVALDDAAALARIADDLEVSFYFEGEHNRFVCNGAILGDIIRSEAVSQAASKVSAHPEVRAELLELQRELGRSTDSVLEGRDIGTVVFPDAELKIFLTASDTVRAQRRAAQLRDKGLDADEAQILSEIRERDTRDSQRATAPLRQADDAHALDTTSAAIDEIIEAILQLVDQARA